MGLEILDLPCPGDGRVWSDEIGQSPRPVLVLVVGRAGRFKDLADLALGVGHQPELEVLAIAECLLRLAGVVGDAEDLGTCLYELWGSITEPLAFERSARAVGDGIPPQDGPLATEVSVGEGLPVLIYDGELGYGVARR